MRALGRCRFRAVAPAAEPFGSHRATVTTGRRQPLCGLTRRWPGPWTEVGIGCIVRGAAAVAVPAMVPAGRRYLPGTMVLETSWGTQTGWIIVRDVLLIGPWHHEDEISHNYHRAPTDYDAEHVLLRTVRCVKGEVQLEGEQRAATAVPITAPRGGPCSRMLPRGRGSRRPAREPRIC
jgi:hypothetical protein